MRSTWTLFLRITFLASEFATGPKTGEYITLAKAFRGELVPQDPHDEPASALLARLHEQQAPSQPKPARKKRAKRL